MSVFATMKNIKRFSFDINVDDLKNETDIIEMFEKKEIIVIRGIGLSYKIQEYAKKRKRNEFSPAKNFFESIIALINQEKEAFATGFHSESDSLVVDEDYEVSNFDDFLNAWSKGKLGGFYVSSVVQCGNTLLQKFMSLIDHKTSLIASIFQPNNFSKFSYPDDSFWLFFGYSKKARTIEGREEHTDFLQFSGTWHYQLIGSKTWYLRKKESDEPLRFCIQHGDFIALNTSKWLHHTQLENIGESEDLRYSVSFARDFNLKQTQ
eukprot:snap_masked-scaffold_4-processed-gene-20.23-mRNA-1 protein AED:1.00 eAED:1.00 QI:0/-1/0/0/-1/1/1/0/263